MIQQQWQEQVCLKVFFALLRARRRASCFPGLPLQWKVTSSPETTTITFYYIHFPISFGLIGGQPSLWDRAGLSRPIFLSSRLCSEGVFCVWMKTRLWSHFTENGQFSSVWNAGLPLFRLSPILLLHMFLIPSVYHPSSFPYILWSKLPLSPHLSEFTSQNETSEHQTSIICELKILTCVVVWESGTVQPSFLFRVDSLRECFI